MYILVSKHAHDCTACICFGHADIVIQTNNLLLSAQKYAVLQEIDGLDRCDTWAWVLCF